MATCQLSGKSWMRANRVSHSNIKSKRKVHANVQKKRVYDVETGLFVTLKLSARALRTLNRKSLSEALAGK